MPALEVTGPAMPRLTVILDPATLLVVRHRYQTPAVPGPGLVDTEEEFSDFRDVAGLKVPFSTVVRVAGDVTVRRRIRSVRYNVPLDPAIFSRPL
jgi:hypothetical protein